MPGGIAEGAVGVLQDQGSTHGTIDVTMGIGNPCPQEPDSAVSVQTWCSCHERADVRPLRTENRIFEGTSSHAYSKTSRARILGVLHVVQAAAASTAFTYFGELYNGNTPASGTYRFTITPYADAAGTHALSSAVNTGAVRVVDGRFRTPVTFDFAAPADRHVWLGVEAQAADGTITAFPAKKQILLPIASDAAAERLGSHRKAAR